MGVLMELAVEDTKPAINRLKRARGQLDAVIRMLESEADCEQVIQQLAACSKAIDKAGYQIIATGLKQCLDSTSDTTEVQKQLEKVFLSFS